MVKAIQNSIVLLSKCFNITSLTIYIA